MDGDWMSVAAAAAVLGVDPSRVRHLAARGDLPAVRVAGNAWMLDPVAVRRYASLPHRAGRPLSALSSWRLLRMLEPYGKRNGRPVDSGRADRAFAELKLDRVQRHRLRAAAADLSEPGHVARLLRRRARLVRMRAHESVLDRVSAHDGVWRGGGDAVAALGGGLASGGRPRLYIDEALVGSLSDRYRLHLDPEGQLDVMVMPGEVGRAGLVPEPGQRDVPLAVAWIDLLDDSDPRARSAAADWLEQLPRPLLSPRSAE
jgi:hypothetical protein